MFFQLNGHRHTPAVSDGQAISTGQPGFPLHTAQAPVDCPDTHPFRGVGGQAIEPMQTSGQHEMPTRRGWVAIGRVVPAVPSFPGWHNWHSALTQA
jgi:hypothetical protein